MEPSGSVREWIIDDGGSSGRGAMESMRSGAVSGSAVAVAAAGLLPALPRQARSVAARSARDRRRVIGVIIGG